MQKTDDHDETVISYTAWLHETMYKPEDWYTEYCYLQMQALRTCTDVGHMKFYLSMHIVNAKKIELPVSFKFANFNNFVV